MRLFLTGGSGLVGRRILADRLRKGDEVVALTRRRDRITVPPDGSDRRGHLEVIEGDPSAPGAWQDRVDGCDAVINLAGAGLLDRRWTPTARRLIRESRIDSTYQIVRAIEQARRRPRTLLNASAVGFYGNRDDRRLTESDEAGEGFLAHLCAEWEAQALRAEPGCRVVCMRFGMVLDPSGGALKKMLTPFRLGMGGRLGSGNQFVSWIAWQDLVAMVDLLLRRTELRGPVNLVAPEPVTNRSFTRALGEVLHRPAMLPVPTPLLRLVMGPAATVVLSSQCVLPDAVARTSFQWMSPTIERGLRNTLRSIQRDTVATGGVIVIDIDEISPGSPLLRCVLRQADESGVRIVLATSMGPEGVREFLMQSRIDCPVIAADGAVVVQRDPSVMLHQRLLPPALQATALAAIAEVDALTGGASQVTLEDVNGARRVSSESAAVLPIKDCIRVRVRGPEEILAAIVAKIGPTLWQPGKVQLHRDRPGRLDLLDANADRSVAMQRLAQRWSVNQSDTFAIVKGIRSSGLAQWCGFSIALAGSPPRIRALCDRSTGLDGMDGVAEAVESLR